MKNQKNTETSPITAVLIIHDPSKDRYSVHVHRNGSSINATGFSLHTALDWLEKLYTKNGLER